MWLYLRYAAAVMDTVPVGYWRMDEPAGATEAKDSGMWQLQNRHSTAAVCSAGRGGPAFAQPTLHCSRESNADTGGGKCADFTRATAGLMVPPVAGLLPAESFAVELWARVQLLHAASDSPQVAVSSLGTAPGGATPGFEIGVRERRWYFTVGSTTLAGPLVEDGIPAHVVGVFANGKMTLCVPCRLLHAGVGHVTHLRA